MSLSIEVFEALEAIRLADPEGLLKPEKVVEAAAADRTSELGRQFEWNDKEAAHEYRVGQARNLIRAHVTFEPRVQRETRAYVSVPTDRENGGGYRQTSEVIDSAELTAQAIEELRKTVLSLRRRFSYLPRRFDPMFDQLDATVAEYAAKSKGDKKGAGGKLKKAA